MIDAAAALMFFFFGGIFTVLFLAFGSGVLVYILLWIFVPEE